MIAGFYISGGNGNSDLGLSTLNCVLFLLTINILLWPQGIHIFQKVAQSRAAEIWM